MVGRNTARGDGELHMLHVRHELIAVTHTVWFSRPFVHHFPFITAD